MTPGAPVGSTVDPAWAIADRAERRVETSCGPMLLRPETANDAPFLKALFAANNALVMRQAALPPEIIGPLLEFQHRSQTETYRAMFPHAVWSVVMRDGEPIGRLIEHDEGERVYIVDMALAPAHQAKGLGGALLEAVLAVWSGRGRGARAKVLVTNEASLRMCRRLGFEPFGEPEQGHQELFRPRRSE